METFTTQLFNHIANNSDQDNVVISPMSIYSALGLVGKGARTETFHEIKKAMNVISIRNMMKFIRKTAMSPSLDFANRVFVDNSVTVKKVYSSVLHRLGAPEVMHLDFQSEAQPSRELINLWVSNNTHGKIENLIPADAIDSNTRMVIANAVAMKVSWPSKFNKPRLGSFNVSPNEQIKSKMLLNTDIKCLISSPGDDVNMLKSADIITLPFESDDVMFVAVMPKVAGDFSEFESGEGYDKLFATLNSMHPRKHPFKRTLRDCNVKIPQFDVTYNYDNLKTDLEAMGVRSAFDESRADFSGMVDQNVHVSDVAHKATFSLDRDGVEGTAATAFTVSFRSMRYPKRVTMDRPFLYMIRSTSTGAIIFMGKLVRP